MDAQKQERDVTEEKDLICDEDEVILEGEAEEQVTSEPVSTALAEKHPWQKGIQGKTFGITYDIFRLERESEWFSSESEKSVCKLQEETSKVILPGTDHSRQDDDSTGTSRQVTSLTLEPIIAPTKAGDGNRDSKTRQECCSHPPSVDAIGPVEEEEAEQDILNDNTAEMQGDQEVLIDVGIDGGSDYYSSDANGFQWKTLAVLLYVFVIAAFVMFGKMSHIDVNKDIPPSPDENKMNMDQSVKVILHQIQKRSTKQLWYYKILDPSEICTDGIKQIQDKCQDSEQAVCVRNRTWENLVAVCVDNIPMNDYCPVFTEAIDEGTTIHVVQEDFRSDCKNCSHYSLWDVEKYPQCLQLEIMDTTTIDSNAATTNSSFVTATHDGEGLSGGTIAGIVIGVICFLLVILILVCLCRLGYLQNLMDKIFPNLRGIPVGQNVV